MAGLITVTVRSFSGQGESIGRTLTEAVDDTEDWLVNDSLSRRFPRECLQVADRHVGAARAVAWRFALSSASTS
jgi:hypothetical protein